MITEVCPHCGNTVGGVFYPSTSRKFVTGLVKKHGMSAALSAAGSVDPEDLK